MPARRSTPAELKRRLDPPEPPSAKELGEYVRHLQALLPEATGPEVQRLLKSWTDLFVGIWGDHRRSVGKHAKEAEGVSDEPSGVVTGADDVVRSVPYVAYTAAWPRKGRGQPGWKLRFAWACTMDGFDPRCAAIFEDVAVRSTPALRREYKQWLWSDPGHQTYVLKRWRQTFRSLFDNLEDQDRVTMREHRLPGTEDWIGTRSGRGKRRRE